MNKSEIKEFIKSIYSDLENDVLDDISGFCDYIKLSKGDELIQEGRRHHFFYFIIQGSVKSYYSNEGKEICSWFAFDKEIVSTIKTFEGQPSNETIKLLEDSEFIRLDTIAFQTLSASNISVLQLINEMITEHAIFLESLLYLKSKPSKERFDLLIKSEPQILQKVSLTDIASFLGISRETLSRIRSR